MLPKDVILRKREFELYTPRLSEVFNQKDLGVEDLVELDQYMNIVFDEVSLEVGQKKVDKDKLDVFETQNGNELEQKDWWLSEDAFKIDEKRKGNPFVKRKN